MIRYLTLLTVFLFTAAVDCVPHPTPAPVPASLPDACSELCGRGRELRCGWAEATMQGHPCEEVCENANDAAGPIRWDMSCRIGGSTCDAIARCQ